MSYRLVLFDDWIHPERVPDVPPFVLVAEFDTVREFYDDRRGNALSRHRLGEFDASLERSLATVEEINQERRIEDHSNRSRSLFLSLASVSRLFSNGLA